MKYLLETSYTDVNIKTNKNYNISKIIIDGKLSKEYIYKNNQCVKEISLNENNGRLMTEYNLYNDDNQLVESGECRFLYNDKKQLIRKRIGILIYEYEYDDNGRLIKEIYGDNITHEFEYNDIGLLIKETDNGNIVCRKYDYKNRLIELLPKINENDKVSVMFRWNDDDTLKLYDDYQFGCTIEYKYEYDDNGNCIKIYVYRRSLDASFIESTVQIINLIYELKTIPYNNHNVTLLKNKVMELFDKKKIEHEDSGFDIIVEKDIRISYGFILKLFNGEHENMDVSRNRFEYICDLILCNTNISNLDFRY